VSRRALLQPIITVNSEMEWCRHLWYECINPRSFDMSFSPCCADNGWFNKARGRGTDRCRLAVTVTRQKRPASRRSLDRQSDWHFSQLPKIYRPAGKHQIRNRARVPIAAFVLKSPTKTGGQARVVRGASCSWTTLRRQWCYRLLNLQRGRDH
jgi:hypothetical protein